MSLSSTSVAIAITGASGAIYATRTLAALLERGVHVELVVSDYGRRLLRDELGDEAAVERPDAVPRRRSTAPASAPGRSTLHSNRDLGATIASGSHGCSGMAIVPCSMKTLAGVAHGLSRNLVERAADVMLKERRPLVIVPRETPMSLPQLRNMVLCAEAGAMILPAMPAFYQLPKTLDDLADFMAGKILARSASSTSCIRAWTGPGWLVDRCQRDLATRDNTRPSRNTTVIRRFVSSSLTSTETANDRDRPLQIPRPHRRHVRCDRRPLRPPQSSAERRHRSPLAAAGDSGRSRCPAPSACSISAPARPISRSRRGARAGRGARGRRRFRRRDAARRPRRSCGAAASSAPIALVRGDATRIPVADRSVDAVTIAFGIRNVEQPDAACGEIHRVLRPAAGSRFSSSRFRTTPIVRAGYLCVFPITSCRASAGWFRATTARTATCRRRSARSRHPTSS